MSTPVVTFNYDLWLQMFPEFDGTVNSVQAQLYFDQAVLFHRNDGTGPVEKEDEQLRLLNLLTAHFAQVMAGSTVAPATPLIGPITNASEGSVSVSTDGVKIPGAYAWLATTKYGVLYWGAIQGFINMRYRVPMPRQFAPPYPYYFTRR